MEVLEWLALLIALVAGSMVIYARWGSFPTSGQEGTRLLRAHPRYATNAFPDEGEGRIVGTALPEEPTLVAPVSGRECLAYVLRVSRYRRDGRSAEWERVLEVTRTVDFAVTDDSGRALVHAAGGRFDLAMDRADQSDSMCPATAKIEALLREHGLTSVGDSFRYDEGALLPGERVAVCGLGRYEAEDDGARAEMGYREQAKRLVVGLTHGNDLLISNSPSTFG